MATVKTESVRHAKRISLFFLSQGVQGVDNRSICLFLYYARSHSCHQSLHSFVSISSFLLHPHPRVLFFWTDEWIYEWMYKCVVNGTCEPGKMMKHGFVFSFNQTSFKWIKSLGNSSLHFSVHIHVYPPPSAYISSFRWLCIGYTNGPGVRLHVFILSCPSVPTTLLGVQGCLEIYRRRGGGAAQWPKTNHMLPLSDVDPTLVHWDGTRQSIYSHLMAAEDFCTRTYSRVRHITVHR